MYFNDHVVTQQITSYLIGELLTELYNSHKAHVLAHVYFTITHDHN